MSKLEMVKNLADSRNRTLMDLAGQMEGLQSSMDQLPPSMAAQITATIAPTLSQIEALQSSLDQLPPAVAAQLMETIGPLMGLPGQVQKALEAFDQITQAQRDAVMDITEEMTRQSTSLMDARAMALDAAIKQAGESAAQLATHFQSAEVTAANLSKAVASVNGSAVQMRDSASAILNKLGQDAMKIADAMGQQLEQMKQIAKPPPPWKLPAMLLVCSLASAGLTLTGARLLSEPRPPVIAQIPAQVQSDADLMKSLLSKATPKESALMKEIVSRPAK